MDTQRALEIWIETRLGAELLLVEFPYQYNPAERMELVLSRWRVSMDDMAQTLRLVLGPFKNKWVLMTHCLTFHSLFQSSL
jgi:hypothetical protein